MHQQDRGDTFNWVAEDSVIKVLFIKVKAGRRETSKNCCWTCSGRALSSPVAGGASRGSDD